MLCGHCIDMGFGGRGRNPDGCFDFEVLVLNEKPADRLNYPGTQVKIFLDLRLSVILH